MAASCLSRLAVFSLKHFCCQNANNTIFTRLAQDSLPVGYIQTREMSRVKTRHTHPPFFWVKKTRTKYNEKLTAENAAFIQETIFDQYGPATEIGSPSTTNPSPLKDAPLERGKWEPKSVRTGLIARKIGIYPMWKKDGSRFLTTLLQVVDNHVIKYVPPEEYRKRVEGRSRSRNKPFHLGALVVGAESADPQLFNKEYCNLFADSGVMPKRKLARFFVTSNAIIQPGTPLYVNHFRVGDFVDVYGITIDRGFQGVVKRWGMKGGPASHGTTKSHRRPGNIAGGSGKSKVFPGKKMPGHMGGHRRTQRGVKIWRINNKYNVMWVTGPAVPGPTNGYVYIHDTVLPLRKPETPPPFPTFYMEDLTESLPEEVYDEELHPFSDPTIILEDEK